MPTFIFHPEHDGPHPVVLYLMDAPSIRPALKEMASRLATAGYYVMLPYLFYRGGPFREFGMSDDDMHQRRELMGSVTPTSIIGDGQALLGVADADPHARNGKTGAVGFCMSGGLTIALAKAIPERIAAAASIHGAWLVRDAPDSPHLDVGGVQAEVYFAWCDNDATAPADTIPVITAALDRGWCCQHRRLPHRCRARLRAGGTAVQPSGVRVALGASPLVAATQPLTQQRRAASVGAAVDVGGARDGRAQLGVERGEVALAVAPARYDPGVQHPEVTAGDVRAIARVGSGACSRTTQPLSTHSPMC